VQLSIAGPVTVSRVSLKCVMRHGEEKPLELKPGDGQSPF
jgi:hypothetical protein